MRSRSPSPNDAHPGAAGAGAGDFAVDPRRERLAPGEPWPLPDPLTAFGDHSELLLLAMLLWGEARGECDQARFAVGRTVLRRAADGAAWNGRDVKGAILAKWQYSCLNEGDPNRDKLRRPTKHDDPSVWVRGLMAADALLRGADAPDPAPGADHYYDVSLDRAGKPPAWAAKYRFVKQIGRLKFYQSR